jgi:hypothetical protein
VREGLAKLFYPNGQRAADEIFVSDGSKCDIARINMMFGKETTVAVQVRGCTSVYVCVCVCCGGVSCG